MSRRPLARGDILLVRFPFTDLSAGRVRPALVVGRSGGDDVIVAFITSRADRADPRAEHLLEPTDPGFASTGLRVPSVIRLNKIATLNRELVRRRLGRIERRAALAVGQALRYVFDL